MRDEGTEPDDDPPSGGKTATHAERPRSAPPPRKNDEGEQDREPPYDDGHQPLRTKKQKPWYRRPKIAAIVIAAVLIIAVGGALFWRHSRRYEATDDAFIDIAPQRVSSQVAGRVLRVLVNDNEDVRVGQPLVELDPAEFENRLEQARAAQAEAEAKLADARAQRVVAEAQRDQAQANAGVASANANNAANDLRRAQELWQNNSGGLSRQQLDHNEAEAASAQAQLRATQKGVAAEDAQVAHAARQIDAARAAVRSTAAQVAQAELQLSYAQVKASAAGRVARKTVAPGNYVQPGADLMAVVPTSVYVTANFKETQLTRIRAGQPVAVTVDAYPDLELKGRIDSVQPATGQVFDVLPSQNAAGNWVKVVQRVPVKITLDTMPTNPAERLAPGLSVRTKVTVR